MTEWLPHDDPAPEQSLLVLAQKSLESLLLSLTAADVPFVSPPLTGVPNSTAVSDLEPLDVFGLPLSEYDSEEPTP